MSDVFKSAIEAFHKLDMYELSNLLSNAPDDSLLAISGILECYLDINILDEVQLSNVTSESNLDIIEAWQLNKHVISYLILKYIQLTPPIPARIRYNNLFLYRLTGALMLFSLIYITTITFIPIPESNIRFADTALGFILGSIVSPIVGYFYVASSDQRTYTKKPNIPVE